MPVGILLTIGKYLFIVLLYLFVVLVLRALISQALTAKHRLRSSPAPQRPRRAPSAPIRPSAHRPAAPAVDSQAAAPAPAEEPQPAPANRVAQVLNLRGSDSPGGVREPRLREEAHRPPILVVQTSADIDLLASLRYLLTATVTLGRGPYNTVVLPDRYVSKEHAVIYPQESHHFLADQGSTNGTYHNGTRITEPVPLSDGDEIIIGATVFKYQIESPTSSPG